MVKKVKYIAVDLLLIVIAFQILNLGINAINFKPISSSDRTMGSFNYMNSMVEYVAEIILKHVDAYPEFGTNSTSSKAQLEKHISFNLFAPVVLEKICNFKIIAKKRRDFYSIDYAYLYLQDITPPPPKQQAFI